MDNEINEIEGPIKRLERELYRIIEPSNKSTNDTDKLMVMEMENRLNQSNAELENQPKTIKITFPDANQTVIACSSKYKVDQLITQNRPVESSKIDGAQKTGRTKLHENVKVKKKSASIQHFLFLDNRFCTFRIWLLKSMQLNLKQCCNEYRN